jgi:uncharacterized membrane protein YphA (DoxX/SURF4 family)
MNTLTDWLIGWPERTARHLEWLAPIFARIVAGWIFLWSGRGKLHNLPAITRISQGGTFPPRIFLDPSFPVLSPLAAFCCW